VLTRASSAPLALQEMHGAFEHDLISDMENDRRWRVWAGSDEYRL
jgi:hypothetical protein